MKFLPFPSLGVVLSISLQCRIARLFQTPADLDIESCRSFCRPKAAAALVLMVVGAALAGCGGGGGGGGSGGGFFPPATTAATADAGSALAEPSAASHSVGGSVSGLAGAGLVLQNNEGDDLALPADGSFHFEGKLPKGAAFAVRVQSQPSNPAQTCTVNNAGGTVADADVDSVKVVCATNGYPVGGTVTGLAGGGLVLQNNVGDDLPVAADGSFRFPQPVASGAAYEVTVKAQPTTPAQICSVSRHGGIVTDSAVADVMVVCATRSFTVSGMVSGLAGTGLTLQNAGADPLAIAADGAFTFPLPVASGGTYEVGVKAQPTQPAQTCTVNNGTGPVSDNNIASVTVTCATHTHAVGGTVSGLMANASIVLRNNGTEDLLVKANGVFSFPTPVADGAGYAVDVHTQPSMWQTCALSKASGTATAAVSDVAVVCTVPKAHIATLAGSGAFGSANGTGAAASFGRPEDVAVDASGNTYVADKGNHMIRKITPAGEVTTLAGSGAAGSTNGTGVAASFSDLNGVAVDASGSVYVVDRSGYDQSIRKVTPAGEVTTLADSGMVGWPANYLGTSTSTTSNVSDVAVDASGNVYATDSSAHVILKITPAGQITTLAGSMSVAGSADGIGTAASFRSPQGLAVDASGNVYVADAANNLIRKITPAGEVTTLAGSGAAGSADGTGAAASLDQPEAVAVDASGNVYVASAKSNLIRKITPVGEVTTLVALGTGYRNGLGPQGIAVDASGHVYLAGTASNSILKITPVP
jgi:serine/threonine-protein kinase